MSKLLSHLPALCNTVKRVALEAGEITLDYFDEGAMIATDIKGDGSPVTEADRKAEAFIIKSLQNTLPDIPVVAEEIVAGGQTYDLSAQEYFWLVDPLDGTREFASGSPDYTVNIALIKNNEPILGVIYAPAHGEMFAAAGEGTATRWLEESGNEKPIHVRAPSRKGVILMSSKNRSHAETDKFAQDYKVEKIIRRGSSLKFCAIAMGKADIYPGFGPTCEWDTAAGQAILLAAGGDVVDFEGNPLRYGTGTDARFYNPPFIARSHHFS